MLLWLVPRKEYKTITVKIDVFYEFLEAKSYARTNDAKLDNTKFLKHLLQLYVESKSWHFAAVGALHNWLYSQKSMI